MAHHQCGIADVLIPLRTWGEDEAKIETTWRDSQQQQQLKKESILRKVTVAYGLAELIYRAVASSRGGASKMTDYCNCGNFIVRTSGQPSRWQASWNNIKGVDMISPSSSLQLAEPSFLSNAFSAVASEETSMGRCLEVSVESPMQFANVTAAAFNQDDQDNCCHLLGVLLYELFSKIKPFSTESIAGGSFPATTSLDESVKEPAQKKSINNFSHTEMTSSSSSKEIAKDNDGREQLYPELKGAHYVPLQALGIPSPICLLVKNLIDCKTGDIRHCEAYTSMQDCIADLHLILRDPNHFLFNSYESSIQSTPSSNGIIPLQFRIGKLYGRDAEVRQITDAFCRVSSGKNEAFFIGGFSGSGKSSLVESLKSDVAAVGGYVITHKFDQMSQSRPLWEVISVFNALCLLIRDNNSSQDLLNIVNKLNEVFGADLSVLSRLLPNIQVLFPDLEKPSAPEQNIDNLNFNSICFSLQMFMRVASSQLHPVMIFLDDLQWADGASLDLIHGILSDTTGQSCVFFVGSYRDNEVEPDHATFNLMAELDLSDVSTTNIRLDGLDQNDLNTMISDALCTFPRISMPLSDIVFQKTKGNPFFVMTFMRSLVDKKLLQYSLRERRWIWDTNKICSEDITNNVLYLLSTEMNELPESIQTTLKVLSCFGIRIDESIIGYLNATSLYSNLRQSLDQAVCAGFVTKVGTHFKFAHDRVREAASSLIHIDEKEKFHFNLGMCLYSTTKGQDIGEVVFAIADQINHDMYSLTQRPAMCVDIAELNLTAAKKAIDRSDHVTARSYLNVAISLLPQDHWTIQYELSLCLYSLLAKTAYACGCPDKANIALQTVLAEGRCTEDKLDAYHLLATLKCSTGNAEDAYNTTRGVLLQLGETIPDELDSKETAMMMKRTNQMLRNMSNDDISGMKRIDKNHGTPYATLKLYSILVFSSFYAKPRMMPFLTSRLVQLSILHGLCKHSVKGLVQYSAFLCSCKLLKDIPLAYRIGKLGMSLMKRFHFSDPHIFFNFNGFVAVHYEPLQTIASSLHHGFNIGMTIGDTASAFICAVQHVRASFICGVNLSIILKEIDYYLKLTGLHENALCKEYMQLFQETISLLIDKGESNGVKRNTQGEGQSSAQKCTAVAESMSFHRATQSFWLGHSERCHHYAEKMLPLKNETGWLKGLIVLFYHGLNSFQILKKKNSNTVRNRKISKNAIKVMKAAAENSEWNYRNKLHLLEAELFSFEGKVQEANTSYAAAITASRCSKFVHEQGLACELAGFHYERIGDTESAQSFFNQAKLSYTEWGSKVKVDSMNHHMERFQVSLKDT